MHPRTITDTKELPLGDYSQMMLPELANHIWDEADKAGASITSAVCHAIKCGAMLQAAKAKVPHGSWMKWVEDNTQLSQATVNTYMRIAANSQRAVNLESIRGTLKLLAEDKLEARSDFSESYVPFDGETLPQPEPDVAFKAKPAPPVVVEADIVESERPTADDAESDALVIDGTKPEALTHDEVKRLEVLEASVDEGLAAIGNNGMALATIKAMMGQLSAEELSELALESHRLLTGYGAFKSCGSSKHAIAVINLIDEKCRWERDPLFNYIERKFSVRITKRKPTTGGNQQ